MLITAQPCNVHTVARPPENGPADLNCGGITIPEAVRDFGGSRNVIIRRELGIESLGSTPTRFRHISLRGRKLQKNEAAKGGNKANPVQICTSW